MHKVSRRAHLQGLLGMAALAGLPRALHAEDQPIPPEGIGHRIKHLSYSDIGGRPDSVQIMSNRKPLYVGHMFGDGVTILDASDPRRLKPVSFFYGWAVHAYASLAIIGRSASRRQRRQYRRHAVL